MHILKEFGFLMKATVKEWMEDGASSIAAALAYYAIFSLAPLLILIALFMGAFINAREVEEGIVSNVEATVGSEAAATFRNLLTNDNANVDRSNVFSTALWLGVVLWGASGLFAQLQSALNKIWEVRGMPGRSPLVLVKNRALSFAIVLFACVLLLATMLINTSLNIILKEQAGTTALDFIVRPLQFLVSLSMMTIMFATVFKILPDVTIRWRDVWVGAAFTALLFFIGQFIVGLYLTNSNVGSVFGAAGSLTVILVWIYYSAQILLFGAEFTEVWARYHGVDLKPDADAVWINPHQAEREKQAGRVSEAEKKLEQKATEQPAEQRGNI